MQNKHVVNSKLTVSVDWIAFTLDPEIHTVASAAEILGFTPEVFTALEHGAMGYKSLHKLTDYCVKIYSDGQPGMGVHVEITGSAVAHVLEAHHIYHHLHKNPFNGDLVSDWSDELANDSLRSLLKMVEENGHMTRIDLALDDHEPHFTPDSLRGYIAKGQMVSKFRNFRREESASIARANEKKGDTLYLGSRSSDTFLRVYDKQLEQNQKHPEQEIVDPWIRWEFQIMKARADFFAYQIIDGVEVGDLFYDVLNNYVRLIELDNQNVSRCSILPEWRAFLKHCNKLSLYCPPAPRTYFDKKNWVEQQVMPTLAGILLIDGYDFISSNLDQALNRMKDTMWDIVDQESSRRQKAMMRPFVPDDGSMVMVNKAAWLNAMDARQGVN